MLKDYIRLTMAIRNHPYASISNDSYLAYYLECIGTLVQSNKFPCYGSGFKEPLNFLLRTTKYGEREKVSGILPCFFEQGWVRTTLK